MLNCRECKRSLVKFLSDYFLHNIHLQDHQTLYVAGGFDGPLMDTAWYVQGNSRRQPDPAYTCNAEETDTRIWLHVKRTTCSRILLLSQDTDVYHIGLPLERHNKQVIIQVSPMNSRELHFLKMSSLSKAFLNDPDLSNIITTDLPQVMQTLLVYTLVATIYTSFFSQIGKATFLRYFYQYTAFLTGRESQGTLADTGLEGEAYNNGFLAVMMLNSVLLILYA